MGKIKLYKIPVLIFVKPRKTLKEIIKTEISPISIFVFMLILNSIGPLLSLYSLYITGSYTLTKSLIYAVGTYLLDIISIFVFSLFLNKSIKNFSLSDSFKFSVIIYTPIWLSDIVDINQYLRPLSSLGLIYSLFLLFLFLKIINKEKGYILVAITLFLLLYFFDSFIAELIITNPILEKIKNLSYNLHLKHYG